MGKKSKIGKQRKDKFYQLAKESGFRSRSAFKLIQLNRKFGFLQKSRVCIDLCAAPGGWMQVSQQNMPLSSIVIGVDLFPIKPVAGCIGLIEDITTEKCKSSISKELKTWKADIVLHDGAPNVGMNWIHDAYQQACLTLSALKLATNFLRKGGWFITKVFRSKDYHPLIWVLKQLFKKVHATKPQASRNESAEIFVVCQFYIAPDKIDPKFLDTKYVFEELDIENKNKVSILHPEKKKKARAEGYPENDYTLHHAVPVLDFVNKENVIEALQSCSQIVFDDESISSHPRTTPEIKECCKDIKVLGRKDLKSLISWWKAMKEFLNPQKKDENESEKDKEDATKVVSLEDQEDQEENDIAKQIADLEDEEDRELKRKKKKTVKERKKLNEKMNLKMVIKGDSGPTELTDELFHLEQIKNSTILSKIDDQTPNVVAETDSESEDEYEVKKKTVKYDPTNSKLDSSGLFYKDSDSEIEMDTDSETKDTEGLGFSGSEDDEKTFKKKSNKKQKTSDESSNPLIVSLDNRDAKTKQIHKAELWFQKDAFKNLDEDMDENLELNQLEKICKKKGGTIIEDSMDNVKTGKNRAKDPPKSAGLVYPTGDSDSSSDSDYDMERKQKKRKGRKANAEEKPKEAPKVEDKELSRLKKVVKMDEEGLALSTLIVTSQKRKRDIIDAAWNRYTFNDQHLPDWFAEDEKKHMKKDIPVPQALINEYKENLKEVNARPIKKVMEAKARKKRRAYVKMQKAKKKIEHLMDNEEVTDQEKAKQIKLLYKKAKSTGKKEVTYVVAKKHTTAKRMKRPAGVKGIYKVVDPRMKKDLRAAKAKEKTTGRKKFSKNKNMKTKKTRK